MKEVCVVGAGAVGLTSAWYLAEAGWRVTLLDEAGAVGTGASYLNGGQLSYSYVSPLADRGVLLKALKWLFQTDGPLRFRPAADMSQWSWLMQFVLNCTREINRKTTARLLRLGAFSKACMQDLITHHAVNDFDWRQAGKLIVYRSEAAFRNAAGAAATGNGQFVLSAGDCLLYEPALAAISDRLAGGILTKHDAVADCFKFCDSLYRSLSSHPNFVGLIAERATRFDLRNGRLRLTTSAGIYDSESFVVAAGVQSARLVKSLGIDLPIYPLKGYSLTAPIDDRHVAPEISITDFEKKVLYARIGNRLRIAAMVDLVGHDCSLDRRRVDSLRRTACSDMPAAADYANAVPWAGLRPATPGGSPIVGPTSVPGLWLNVGHGALGFTFACGTAGLLSALMSRAVNPLALDNYSWANQ